MNFNPGNFPAAPPFYPLDVVGAKATRARGVNNNGIVVGTYFDALDQNNIPDLTTTHGFRIDTKGFDPDISKWTYDTFDAQGADPGSTVAAGVNDDGYIVGQFKQGTAEYGYRLDWAKKHYAVIDLTAELKSEAQGQTVRTNATCINNALHIGGRVLYGTTAHGFLLTGGDKTKPYTGFKKINPDPKFAFVYGINNRAGDDLVGVMAGPQNSGGVAFLLKDGLTMAPGTSESIKPFPQSTFSRGRGINAARKVVGQYTTVQKPNDNSDGHGYIWDTSVTPWPTILDVVLPLGSAAWVGPLQAAESTYAHGINDDGVIVGEFKDADGIHGFMLNPMTWNLWRQWWAAFSQKTPVWQRP